MLRSQRNSRRRKGFCIGNNNFDALCIPVYETRRGCSGTVTVFRLQNLQKKEQRDGQSYKKSNRVKKTTRSGENREKEKEQRRGIKKTERNRREEIKSRKRKRRKQRLKAKKQQEELREEELEEQSDHKKECLFHR